MNLDPQPNLDLLRRVLKQIDEHPETHNQCTIAIKKPCGTAMCVAGHGVSLSGEPIDWEEKSPCGYTESFETNGQSIWYRATELFGITDDEADDLFFAGNTREDIQEAAEQIAARAGQTL